MLTRLFLLFEDVLARQLTGRRSATTAPDASPRICVVPAQARSLAVPAESRRLCVTATGRVIGHAAEPRRGGAEIEGRVVSVKAGMRIYRKPPQAA